jgi:hypothetical protein
MSNDNDQQQVMFALIDESEHPVIETVEPKRIRKNRPKKNYCTEEYLVGYGVPVVIVLLVILFIALVVFGMRAYNENCKHTDGAKCRGMRWFFT